MTDKEIVRISYTTNEIGSGCYCGCGHELTHEESRDYRYKKANLCKHRKERQRFAAISGRHYA